MRIKDEKESLRSPFGLTKETLSSILFMRCPAMSYDSIRKGFAADSICY
jgi:hypothetical protein